MRRLPLPLPLPRTSAIPRPELTRSEVFREFGQMSPSPGKQRLVLTEEFEVSAIIALYLEFVVHASFLVPGDGTTLESLVTVKRLVLFLRKYACDGVLKLLLLTVREAIKQPSGVSPLVGFIAGAIAEDAYTCSSSLDVGDWTWSMMSIPGSGLGSANVFDPHHMPVNVWQMIPGMYTWALTTAWKGDPAPRRQDSAMSMSSLGSLRYGYGSHRDGRDRERGGGDRDSRVGGDSRMGGESRMGDRIGDRGDRVEEMRDLGSVHGSHRREASSRRSHRSASRQEPDVQRKVYAWQQWL